MKESKIQGSGKARGGLFFFFFFFYKAINGNLLFFHMFWSKDLIYFYMKCFCKLKSFIIISLHSIKICSTVSGDHILHKVQTQVSYLYNE